MATGITGLLSAGDLVGAENQQMRDRAMKVAQLQTGEAGAYVAGMGGGMLMEGLAGMAGMKTRAQKKQEDVQGILSKYATADQNDPQVLFSLSQDFIQAGYPQLSQSFAERARTLSDTLTDNRINQQLADAKTQTAETGARYTKKPTIEVGNPNNPSQTIRMQLNPDTNQYEVMKDQDGNPYVTDKFSTGEDVNLSTDFMAVKDKDGNIIGAKEIPGSPADIAAKQEYETEQFRIRYERNNISLVLENIDKVKEIYNNRASKVKAGGFEIGQDTIFGTAAKIVGATGIPGTPRAVMLEAIAPIKASIGFDKLDQMRQSSPTGGALGQVSNIELDALQKSIASLSLDNTPEEFYANVLKVQRHYSNMMKLMDAKAKGITSLEQLDLDIKYKVTEDENGEPVITEVEIEPEYAF